MLQFIKKTLISKNFFRKYMIVTELLSRPEVKECTCCDVCIIGGGIIGTAIAREISTKSKDVTVTLLEKEGGLGKHQSSHNSGVIHSGVYYKPDSLKARFSKRGINLILKYCDDNKIPYKTFGKLIVATDASKLNDLRILHDRGVANGVEGLEMLWTKDQIKQIEPSCNGIQALWCPKVGNVDWSVVTESFGKDFERNGGQIFFNTEVDQIAESARADYPVVIKTKENHNVNTKYVIICGGLQSSKLSSLLEADGEKDNPIISLKVDYQFMTKHSIGTNIYGVPDLRIPFLGVHITPRLDGALLLGPNAVPAFALEGYGNDDISLTYLKNTFGSKGFQNMTKKYFSQCLNQIKKSLWPQFQIDELQSLADLKTNDIQKGPTAVQMQLINNDGSFVEDFVIDFFKGTGMSKRVINCKFLPSPAATCSLAIAEFVTEKLFEHYKN